MPRTSVETIALLREHRRGERRVLLGPDEVAVLSTMGVRVLVERGAGVASGHDDRSYSESGAQLVDRGEAWREADVVMKYKAPEPSEYRYFRPGLVLIAFLHVEGDMPLMESLESSGVTAWALEMIEDDDGSFPGCVSDSEIAGTQAVLYGAWLLQSHLGGYGRLLSSVPGVPDPRVVVIGHGNAGGATARTAAALGARTIVLGRDPSRLRRFAATVGPRVECMLNTPENLEEAVVDADLVVGAILISSHDTPAMLTPQLVGRMRPGSVIVDITCGYGAGYMPTAPRPTTFEEPAALAHGVLHVKIDAMPASVPWTASRATAANVFRFVRSMIAHYAHGEPLSRGLSAARVIADGRVLHPELHRQRRLAIATLEGSDRETPQ